MEGNSAPASPNYSYKQLGKIHEYNYATETNHNTTHWLTGTYKLHEHFEAAASINGISSYNSTIKLA